MNDRSTPEGTNALQRGAAPAALERNDFAGAERSLVVETASAVLAEQARAEVESRIVAARRFPRDMDNVRIKLLNDCRRPSFAKIARYKIPNKGEGFTIRFAEAAARQMGNVLVQASVIYDDERKRLVRVMGTDLETNNTEIVEVMVEKTVERSPSALGGRTPISSRSNSNGQVTHTVVATDDELLVKQNSNISKARRNIIMMLLPGDIADEAKTLVMQTQSKDASDDPAAARKGVCDSFASLGVLPDALKLYLGHAIDACSPAEIVDLRQLFAAIREGSTTWGEIMKSRAEEQKEDEPTTARTEPPKTVKDVKERAAAKKTPASGAVCTGCVLPHGIVGGCPLHDAEKPPVE